MIFCYKYLTLLCALLTCSPGQRWYVGAGAQRGDVDLPHHRPQVAPTCPLRPPPPPPAYFIITPSNPSLPRSFSLSFPFILLCLMALTAGESPSDIKGTICFAEDLHFAYPTRPDPVLRGLSAEFPAKTQTVAIVGPSGFVLCDGR